MLFPEYKSLQEFQLSAIIFLSVVPTSRRMEDQLLAAAFKGFLELCAMGPGGVSFHIDYRKPKSHWLFISHALSDSEMVKPKPLLTESPHLAPYFIDSARNHTPNLSMFQHYCLKFSGHYPFRYSTGAYVNDFENIVKILTK